MSTLTQLKELKELLDGGVLTQEEFDAQKKVILEGSAGIKPVQADVAVAPGTIMPVVPNGGMMQPGMPGVMQPGMPGMMQPGMMQPGMMSMWSGLAPPKEHAPSWWQMYKPEEGRGMLGQDGKFMSGQGPDDCGNCLFGFCCVPCALGEVVDWASDGQQPGAVTCLASILCGCCVPCMLADGRKYSERKIHGYHLARGGARISLAFPPRSLHASRISSIATMPPPCTPPL